MKLNYILIPLVTVIVAGAGGAVTSRGMEWYETIRLPGWTPKGGLIGVVWNVIFLLSTISALILWNSGQGGRMRWIKGLFVLNAVLNVLWSVLFFGVHTIKGSIVEMILLEATVLALVVLSWPVSRIASILLVPYAGWVGFATYLAYTIYQLNL